MTNIQVVIDTNVIIAGFRSDLGSAFHLLQLVGSDRFDINLSVPLVLEYQDVLLRQLEHLTISAEDVENTLDYYCEVGHSHKIFYLWRPTLSDPDDEMLLELAVKARCDYLITFNKRDFRGIEQFGIILVTPNEFLKEIGVW